MPSDKIEKSGFLLTRLKLEDIELVRSWRNDPRIQNLMQFRDTITPEMQRAWFAKIDNAGHFYFLVSYKGEPVGMANVKDVNYETHTGESGLLIYPERYQNSALAMSVLILLFDFAFFDLGLNQIHGKILKENDRARRLNSTFGFKLQSTSADGLTEQHVLDKQNYVEASSPLRKQLKI
jgi:UDP-4-amino-4,6-dideoxy-N-acetyl-beta-L-altrosamine N-acetyltransferase